MRRGAIIVAAGSGSRFGGPKQLADLCGQPLFLYSVKAFAHAGTVDKIAVVTSGDLVEECSRLLRNSGHADVIVRQGGATRKDSVAEGLRAIYSSCDVVAVHDAARPLLTTAIIERVYTAAEGAGAALASMPVVDTLKQLENGKLRTVDRTNIFRAQTPQAFSTELLLRAFEYAAEAEQRFTDEAQIIEALGEDIVLVEGDENLFKITFAEDLERARKIIAEQMLHFL